MKTIACGILPINYLGCRRFFNIKCTSLTGLQQMGPQGFVCRYCWEVNAEQIRQAAVVHNHKCSVCSSQTSKTHLQEVFGAVSGRETTPKTTSGHTPIEIIVSSALPIRKLATTVGSPDVTWASAVSEEVNQGRSAATARRRDTCNVLACPSLNDKRKKKEKSVIFKCYSSEKLIALNILHAVVPTCYSSNSCSTEANADKVSCSRTQHTDVGI